MKILAFPFSENPYQKLLYSDSAFSEHTISYLKYDVSNIELLNRFKVFYSLLKYRLNGYTIFHLHWLYNLAPRRGEPHILLFNSFYIPFLLIYIKLIGFKVVWTVHNLIPHEKTSSNDISLTKKIALLANRIIVHSLESITTLEGLINVRNKTNIIPIGAYDSFFLPSNSAVQIRKKLLIAKSDFLFVFFGQIKPYKGLERLLEIFPKIVKEYSTCRLLIVGSFIDKEYQQQLTKLMQIPNVQFIEGPVSDIELSNYISIADALIFPFISVTTSSSVIHALSASKPVIAPYIGSIKDIPREAGYFFDPNTTEELKRSVEQSIINKAKNPQIAKAGNLYASSLSWEKAAQKTINLYQTIK